MGYCKAVSYVSALTVVFLFLLFSLQACEDANELMINGSTGYQIVIPDEADSMENEAAQQLQSYLLKMSGAELPIVEEGEYVGNEAIYIGRTDYAKDLDVDFDRLEEDGYAFKPHEQDFVIAGGSRKGVLYGTYELLEALGFRKYTDDYTHIPNKDAISLPQNDTAYVPEIKYRETSYHHVIYTPESDLLDWQKFNLREEHWGSYVHTFYDLVPPEEYLEDHPEYYSEWEGERPTVDASDHQLCLSNPEVFDILVENLREQIAERPHLTYWSVSQEDGSNLYCTCDDCVELMETYGGDSDRPSGAYIHFVNKVAREFPDYMISTLAYRFTREAPDNIEAEPNVNIMLTNIESERHRPVPETDPAFSEDLENWGRIAEDIIIWDYNVQFSNYIAPFPQLHTIKPNLEYYTDNNVTNFYMQGNRDVGGEFNYLRAYLIGRLLWNPDADDEAIIDDFVHGYYGDAGPYIRQYIDTMRYALHETDHRLRIYGSPSRAKDTYQSAEWMEEYKRLFDEAEQAVEDNPELLKRVQVARMPIMYARLQIGSTEINTPRSLYERTEDGRLAVKSEAKTLLHDFVELAKEQEITKLKEPGLHPDEYLETYHRVFDKMEEKAEAISINKEITPITSPTRETGSSMGVEEIEWYEGLEALTDGFFTPFPYFPWSNDSYHWVGYEGEHMEFILDLGEVQPIESVKMYFYDQRSNTATEFLPEYVTYETSVDGENFQDGVRVDSPHDPNEPYEDMDGQMYEQSFQADMENHEARYIKVHAENILRAPSWHYNAGDPTTIISDAIVVK